MPGLRLYESLADWDLGFLAFYYTMTFLLYWGTDYKLSSGLKSAWKEWGIEAREMWIQTAVGKTVFSMSFLLINIYRFLKALPDPSFFLLASVDVLLSVFESLKHFVRNSLDHRLLYLNYNNLFIPWTKYSLFLSLLGTHRWQKKTLRKCLQRAHPLVQEVRCVDENKFYSLLKTSYVPRPVVHRTTGPMW